MFRPIEEKIVSKNLIHEVKKIKLHCLMNVEDKVSTSGILVRVVA